MGIAFDEIGDSPNIPIIVIIIIENGITTA